MLAEPHPIAREERGALDASAVDEHAVAASRVLDLATISVAIDPGVDARDPVVVDHHLAIRSAPDPDPARADLHLPFGLVADADDQTRHPLVSAPR